MNVLRLSYKVVKIIFVFMSSILCSCGATDEAEGIEVEEVFVSQPSFEKVAEILHQPPIGDYVMVLAHRGDWKNAPENSLMGIKNCIDLGVDIVECDVQISKDGYLVLMHDTSIDRMTTGSGLVRDYTLAELKQFKLLMPDGFESDESIPSLEEALEFSKGIMHLFIDKGDNYLDLIYRDMLVTETLDQTIVGGTLSWSLFNSKYAQNGIEISYIPRAGTGQSLGYITSFQSNIDPIGYFPSCNLILENNDVFAQIIQSDRWILSAPLNFTNCSEDQEGIWDWEIDRGVNAIFTDKPKNLIDHLSSKNLH